MTALVEQICHLLVRMEETCNAHSTKLVTQEELSLQAALAIKNGIAKVQEDLNILSNITIQAIDSLFVLKTLEGQAAMWMNEVEE